MSAHAMEATPPRPLVAAAIVAVLRNRLTILVGCYVVAKYILYSKIGWGYFHYVNPINDFFPAWMYLIHPPVVDALLIALLVIGTRLAFLVALPIAAFMVVGPHSFGFQHYVMTFYMFVWLALKDENGSVWFGRATLSFLYLAATIGKSTPGWINGEHFHHYLKHLHQGPYWILGGEFLFGISFLLPFYLGVLIPVCIVLGMIHSISFGIFDAVGPILGMLLTFVVYRESRNTTVEVTLPDDWRGRSWAWAQRFLLLPNITIKVEHGSIPRADSDGVAVTGNAAWAALLARIPVFSIFCPMFVIRHPRQLGVY